MNYTTTASVLSFPPRTGYCNSTAPIEAKPRAKTLSYIPIPSPTVHFPRSRLRRANGSLITQWLRFAKCFIQSWQHRLRAKTIILMLARIKKERRVATLRPHSIMPLSVVPLRPLPLSYSLYSIFLVLSLRYNTRLLGSRVFVHQIAHQFPRYSTIR